MSHAATIVRGREAEALWVIRDRVRFMGEVAGAGLTILEVDVPPGSGTPPHHHASPEIFRVLAGEIVFAVFGTAEPSRLTADAGTVVTVPARVPHSYQNVGTTDASMLVVVERSMADFFRDLGQPHPPPAGPPTDGEVARVLAACARHGITVLGGPPPSPNAATAPPTG